MRGKRLASEAAIKRADPYCPTENVLSIRFVFPCLSFTDIVNFPVGRSASGAFMLTDQTPGTSAVFARGQEMDTFTTPHATPGKARLVLMQPPQR